MNHETPQDSGQVSAGPERTFLRQLGAELALFGECGPAFLHGAPADWILEGVASSASEIVVHAGERRVREIRRQLRSTHPVAVVGCARDGQGLPVHDQVASTGIISELPERESADALERALSMLGDGAEVVLVLPRRGRAEEGRLQRMMAAACGGNAAAIPGAPGTLFALRGRRVTTVSVESTGAAAPTLPVSAIVLTAGDDGIESTLTDLLLRQHYTPAEVFVLDLGGSKPLDEKLHGIPARSATRVAVFPKHGATIVAALEDALGGAKAPFVHWCRAGERLAPHALAQLGMALEAAPLAMAAVAACALLTGETIDEVLPAATNLEQLLAQRQFPAASALWRTGRLRDAGIPGGSADHIALELAWRHGAEGLVRSPGVLAGTSSQGLKDEEWRAFLGACPVPPGAASRELAAHIALQCGRAEEALVLAAEAGPRAVLVRAQALLRLGRHAEAVLLLEDALRSGHAEAALLFLLLQGPKRPASVRRARNVLLDAGLADVHWIDVP